MNLQKKNLWLVFLSAFFLTISLPCLIPQMRLYFFAPYLVILLYKRPFITCLWGALFCGLIVDLLASYQHLGINAVNYVAATALIYKQRQSFFADSLTTLPLMVYFFCVLSTAIQIPLLYLLEQRLFLTKEWIAIDLFLMPVIDAIFSFGLYIFPFWLFSKPLLKGKDYFSE